jgi:hypothetical protein
LNAPLDFSHENEQLFGDSDGRIVDLRFQRVRGASVILPKQTFSTRSHHYDHHRSGQARLGADNASRIEMNILVTYRVMALMAVIEQAGLPALRVAFHYRRNRFSVWRLRNLSLKFTKAFLVSCHLPV